MRILRKILSFIFVVVFVLSVGTSVAFFLSSTNRLAFKDNKDSRLELYYSSYYAIGNSKDYTIIANNKYGEDQKSVDEITCSLTDESENIYTCSQISKLYDSEGELVRTSYFPGDGYKYSVEGEAKTKTVYSNTNLQNYFSALLGGANSYLRYIAYDVFVPDDEEFIKFETDIKFNFNTFSLLKEINFNLDKGTSKLSADLTFDGKDRLTKVMSGESISLEISYKKTNFEFPSFSNFVEA